MKIVVYTALGRRSSFAIILRFVKMTKPFQSAETPCVWIASHIQEKIRLSTIVCAIDSAVECGFDVVVSISIDDQSDKEENEKILFPKLRKGIKYYKQKQKTSRINHWRLIESKYKRGSLEKYIVLLDDDDLLIKENILNEMKNDYDGCRSLTYVNHLSDVCEDIVISNANELDNDDYYDSIKNNSDYYYSKHGVSGTFMKRKIMTRLMLESYETDNNPSLDHAMIDKMTEIPNCVISDKCLSIHRPCMGIQTWKRDLMETYISVIRESISIGLSNECVLEIYGNFNEVADSCYDSEELQTIKNMGTKIISVIRD